MDPLVAILGANWGNLTGWGVALTLATIIVVGALKETWVPGKRFRAIERLLGKSVALNKDLSDQNGKLLVSNQLTADFFRKTTPVRPTNLSLESDEDDGGGT